MKQSRLILLAALFLSACRPQELPAPIHETGDVLRNQVVMGEEYEQQVWYSLSNNKVIASNDKTIWDLAFENSPEGYRVVLNSSKFMDAYRTTATDLSVLIDTSGYEQGKAYDRSDGQLDSTAIGDWRQNQPVYLINRGSGSSGNLGLVKLCIHSVTENQYEISFQALGGGSIHHLVIPKDEAYTFTYVSLDGNGSLVSVAPKKDEWDLCFTQFTVEIPIPYLVTGVLLNPYQTSAAKIEGESFDEINLEIAKRVSLSSAINTIGYEWKDYDFDAGFYTVHSEFNYVIKSQYEAFYKLHFVDFYDSFGVKGSPEWEFQKL